MKKAIIVHGGIIKNNGFLQILYQKENYVILQPQTIQTHYKRK